MTFDDVQPERRKISTALIVSLAVHLALILLLRHATMQTPTPELAETSLTVRLIPLQALQHLVEKVVPKQEQPRKDDHPKHVPRSDSRSASPPAAPSAPTAPAVPANPQKEAPSAPVDPEELMAAVRRDIGKIDHELRKERPNLPGATMGSTESKLSRGIAAAGKNTGFLLGAPQIEPLDLPDGQGRRVYKVTFPGGGHYCVTYESVGRRDGYDPSQVRGFGQSKTTTCPGDL